MIVREPIVERPRTSVEVRRHGRSVALDGFAGLFSADRLDDGSRLLLATVPPLDGTGLDLGCGWGALAVPLAFEARVIATDRDLLAARATAENATRCGAAVEVRTGLGVERIPERGLQWAVSNLPARLGPGGLRHLVRGAQALLAPEGRLWVVVIAPLVDGVRALGGVVERATARHAVVRFGSDTPEEFDDPYFWEESVLRGHAYRVPADAAVRPGLIEAIARLPGAPDGSALLWRMPFGLLAPEFPDVTIADRDLLSLAFGERNALRLGSRVRTVPAAGLSEVDARADTFVGCLDPASGPAVARAEVAWSRALADRVIWLCPRSLVGAFQHEGAWVGPEVVEQTSGWLVLRGAHTDPRLSESRPSRIRRVRA